LALGPDVTVQYYWIDSSLLRITRTRREGVSGIFADVLAHHWEAMRLQKNDDEDQLRHLLLAACYPLVSADKAARKVYRDACLHPNAVTPQEMSLPDDVRGRIEQVVARRDREVLRAELDGLLGPPTLSRSEAAAMGRACDGILDVGVRLTREGGREGMVRFLGRMDAWLQRCRRRGGDDFGRNLINHLAYQFKVAFYLCYANLWVTLISWLRENRGLDGASERLLRVWHMQNQPVQLPDGRHLPDVFCGQVLALHPLSGFLMLDPALCAAAGRFFGTQAYDRAFAPGQADLGSEYWGLIDAILTAAHLYRQAAEQDWRRGSRGAEGLAVAPSSEGPSDTFLLEEVAKRRAWLCPDCGGPLRYVGFGRDEGSVVADLEFACRICGKPSWRSLNYEELHASLE
jgi:hypothetical protein